MFCTSVVDDSNEVQSRLGIKWKPEDSAQFRDDLGHYTNVAGPNHREVQTFEVGEPVDLFRSNDTSKVTEGETLRIRLVNPLKQKEDSPTKE